MNSNPGKRTPTKVRPHPRIFRVRNDHKSASGQITKCKAILVGPANSDLSLRCPDTLLFHILAYSTCFHTDFVSVGITGFYSYVERKIIVACRLQVVHGGLHSRPIHTVATFPKKRVFLPSKRFGAFIFIPFNPKL